MPNGFESMTGAPSPAAAPWSGLFFASNAAKSAPGTTNRPNPNDSLPSGLPSAPNGLAPVAGSRAMSPLSTAGTPQVNPIADGPFAPVPSGAAVDGRPVTIRWTPPWPSSTETEPLVPKQAGPSGPSTHFPVPPFPASAT